MNMNINEKKALYAFGCPNREATVQRLRLVAALAPDPAAKKLFFALAVKLNDKDCDRWYRCFFYNMRVKWNALLTTSMCRTAILFRLWRGFMSKLTKYEKETIVLFNEADEEAHIQTYNAGLRKRLEAFSKKYPDLCRLDMSMGQGGVSYWIDKSRLSIRFQPPMSEERRRKASELAKQNGFNGQNG